MLRAPVAPWCIKAFVMRVAIVGAGIAGLTAAHDLARDGHVVAVYEASAQAGGLASGFRDERWDWPLERFYHHLFTTDTAIKRLVETIGFGDKLFFRSPNTAQWWNGRGHPIFGGAPKLGPLPLPGLVATGISTLSYPGLSLPNRVRMGATGGYLKFFARDWRALEQVTAADWTRRWMGEVVYRAFVHPLLEGKFGPY